MKKLILLLLILVTLTGCFKMPRGGYNREPVKRVIYFDSICDINPCIYEEDQLEYAGKILTSSSDQYFIYFGCKKGDNVSLHYVDWYDAYIYIDGRNSEMNGKHLYYYQGPKYIYLIIMKEKLNRNINCMHGCRD